jgi:hypothetical protein
MRPWLKPIAVIILVGGCGSAGEQEAAAPQVMEEAAPGAEPPERSARPSGTEGAQGEALPVSLPRIAYSYGYTFRLAADAVPTVQERHLEMCRQLGPARCRVVNLQRSAPSGEYMTAATTLQVGAPIAQAFGRRLVASAAEQGAENIDRSISGEDLSRQMIDTEARIRTREALIRRLTVLLETRSGNIQQAVEAERAISTAQEELDAARGWLAEMRTRVDMSTFNLSYQSGAPLGGGMSDPIREAWGEVGSVFARSVAALILLVGILLPWLIVGAGVFFLVRSLRRRRRARKEAFLEEPPAVSPPAAE